MNNLIEPIPYNPEPDWQAVAELPINECQQALQPLGLSPVLSVYPAYYKLGVPNALAECHSRSEVFERLLQAARALPKGLRLVVLDAWRPFAVQQYLYDSLSDALTEYYPNTSKAELEHLTRQFVSPPSSNRLAPSPHLTGGAVDVTLRDEDGRLLDMGTAFDEVTELSSTSYYEQPDQLDSRHRRIRNNRRILYNVMINAGFSNLPSEWWHYDYGNQLWAWHSGAGNAVYGLVQLPTLDILWRQQLGNLVSSL